MNRMPSALLPRVATIALILCALPVSGCLQSPASQSQGIRKIPPPPEPVIIDLSKAGVVIFKVRVDKDEARDFKPSNKNRIWVFDKDGVPIARVAINEKQRVELNTALGAGAEMHPIEFIDADLRKKLDDAFAAGKKPDVLLTMAYGTKDGPDKEKTIGHAASFRSEIEKKP